MTEREDIIINYLQGNLSEDDQNAFEKELRASESLRKEMIVCSEVWDLSKELKYSEQYTDAAWKKFKTTVEAPKKKLGFDWLKLAASIILLAAISVGIYSLLSTGDNIYSSENKVEQLIFSDVNITLNSNSILTKQDGYGSSHRKVQLDGEAYFEVQASNFPFEITTGNGLIRVLGTKFNVLSSKSSGYVALELYEGSVEFVSDLGENKTLVPGQRLILNEGEIIVSDISWSSPEWINSQSHITCNDVPLKQIMVELSNNYDVDYDLSKKHLTDHYTVVLPKNNLNDCLSILSKISNLQFILDDNVIRVQ